MSQVDARGPLEPTRAPTRPSFSPNSHNLPLANSPSLRRRLGTNNKNEEGWPWPPRSPWRRISPSSYWRMARRHSRWDSHSSSGVPKPRTGRVATGSPAFRSQTQSVTSETIKRSTRKCHEGLSLRGPIEKCSQSDVCRGSCVVRRQGHNGKPIQGDESRLMTGFPMSMKRKVLKRGVRTLRTTLAAVATLAMLTACRRGGGGGGPAMAVVSPPVRCPIRVRSK